jgi:hypothetical protein
MVNDTHAAALAAYTFKKKRGPGKGDVIVPISHYEIEASLAVTVAVGKENSPGKVYPFARDLP